MIEMTRLFVELSYVIKYGSIDCPPICFLSMNFFLSKSFESTIKLNDSIWIEGLVPTCNQLRASYFIKCFHVCTFSEVIESLYDSKLEQLCFGYSTCLLRSVYDLLLEPYGRVSRQLKSWYRNGLEKAKLFFSFETQDFEV